MGREISGGFKGVSVFVVESSPTRSKDDSGDKGTGRKRRNDWKFRLKKYIL